MSVNCDKNQISFNFKNNKTDLSVSQNKAATSGAYSRSSRIESTSQNDSNTGLLSPEQEKKLDDLNMAGFPYSMAARMLGIKLPGESSEIAKNDVIDQDTVYPKTNLVDSERILDVLKLLQSAETFNNLSKSYGMHGGHLEESAERCLSHGKRDFENVLGFTALDNCGFFSKEDVQKIKEETYDSFIEEYLGEGKDDKIEQLKSIVQARKDLANYNS